MTPSWTVARTSTGRHAIGGLNRLVGAATGSLRDPPDGQPVRGAAYTGHVSSRASARSCPRRARKAQRLPLLARSPLTRAGSVSRWRATSAVRGGSARSPRNVRSRPSISNNYHLLLAQYFRYVSGQVHPSPKPDGSAKLDYGSSGRPLPPDLGLYR